MESLPFVEKVNQSLENVGTLIVNPFVYSMFRSEDIRAPLQPEGG